MNIRRIFLLLLVVLFYTGNSQTITPNLNTSFENLNIKMDIRDTIIAQSIPKLTLNPVLKNNIVLPYKVDNSKKVYFPPIYGPQDIGNCGQVSGIYNTYSYEVNRLLKRNAKIVENQFSPDFNLIIAGQDVMHTLRTWTDMEYTGVPTLSDFSSIEANRYFGVSSIYQIIMMPNSYLTFYRAMFNKIDSYYAIDTKTEEGILTLKHWLHNRLNGENDGGVAIIYLAFVINQGGFIEYGPERGKKVIATFPNFANHSVAVVGYNDSVYWDYNNDGLITNDLDVNNDGKIDVRDWEKGAFIVANSDGTNWGNDGYMYIMCSAFTASENNYCIWNNAAYVVNPKLPESPKLTFRIQMNHLSRENIQASIGVSSDIYKTTPDYSLVVPFINFQTTRLSAFSSSRNDTILSAEFGVDLTPLLNFINPNKEARFFFSVYEYDPDSLYSGFIRNFSLINYTKGQNEIKYSKSFVPINNNGNTTLWINANVDFKKPELLIKKVSNAVLNEEYNAVLVGKNGNFPYSFSQFSDYSIEQKVAENPRDGEVVAENVDYKFIKAIKPQFPIKIFDIIWEDSIYISSNGTIQLVKQNPHWPYVYLDDVVILSTPVFAPFLSYLKYDNLSHKIIVSNTDSLIYVRWIGRNVDFINSHYDFGIQIRPSGDVIFEYYNMDSTIAAQNVKGICKGDGKTIVKPDFIFYPNYNSSYVFSLSTSDTILKIQKNGSVYANPASQILNRKIPILITDNSGISNVDTVIFSTWEKPALEISQIIFSPLKEKYYKGDTVFIGFVMKNNSSITQNNIPINLANNSQNILAFNHFKNISQISPSQELYVDNAFKIKILDNFNINKLAQLVLFSQNNRFDQKMIVLILENRKCYFEIGEPYIFNPQFIDLHEGCTYSFNVPVLNQSEDVIRNIKGNITCNNPSINIIRSTVEKDLLNSNDTLVFIFSVSQNIQKGEFIDINVNISSDECSGYNFKHPLYSNKYNNIETYEDSNNLFVLPSEKNQLLIFSNIINTLQNHALLTNKKNQIDKFYERIINADYITGGKGSVRYKIQLNTLNSTFNPRLFITDSDTIRQYYLNNLDDTCKWNTVDFRLNKGVSSLTIKMRFYGEGSILLDDLIIPDYYKKEFFEITPQTLYLKAKTKQTFSSGFYLNTFEDIGSEVNLKFSTPPYKNISWLDIPEKKIRLNEGSVFVPIVINSEYLSEGNYEVYIIAEGKNHTDYIHVVLDVSDGFLSPTESSVVVYPNPSAENYVSTDFICDSETECQFTMYSILGKIVYDKTQTTYPGSGIKTLKWNFADEGLSITKGLYLYRFKIGDKIYSGKIISTY